MFNKIILLGNCTKEGELRYSQSGSGIYNNSIAVTRKYTANGEKKEETMFVDFTAFGRVSEVCNQYLKKGSKILIEGRLNLEQWVDQSGQKRSKHSVTVDTMQMMDSKPDAGGQNQAPQQRQEGQTNSQGYKGDGSSYGNQQQSQQHTAYHPHAQQQKQAVPNQLPQIDIDFEESIPF